jgi:hypothetical protein
MDASEHPSVFLCAEWQVLRYGKMGLWGLGKSKGDGD